MLLKRTTAAAAARVYLKFLSEFPTPQSLDDAALEDLEKALSGVGLQRQRAKAFKGLASQLVTAEGGNIPRSIAALSRIPGLGDYSARAVLSFGHGKAQGIVDANVARVLKRVFQRSLPERPSASILQAVAEALLPRREHRGFNFAVLDLGALVCRYVDPLCRECPLNGVCDFNSGDTRENTKKVLYRLREVRVAKHMPLATLARRSGVSKLTIINIEAGRTQPRSVTLQRLAGALGVTPERLSPEKIC